MKLDDLKELAEFSRQHLAASTLEPVAAESLALSVHVESWSGESYECL
jgi:hypothetical protein